jgi:flagellar basal-body rod protein FlgB
MQVNGLYDATLALLERSLDLRSQRQRLISSNIANIDTPHYRAFDMAVEEELKKSAAGDAPQGLATTHPNHIQAQTAVSYRTVARQARPAQALYRDDGNTVDLDNEMAKLSENSLMYNASAQILAKKLKLIKEAISGDGR